MRRSPRLLERQQAQAETSGTPKRSSVGEGPAKSRARKEEKKTLLTLLSRGVDCSLSGLLIGVQVWW